MLATRAQLESYLRTQGNVSGGAQLPGELLDLLLESASSRIVEQRPERTLEPIPALDDNGQDTDDPVELRFPVEPGQRVVQLPDLRSIDSLVVGQPNLAVGDAGLRTLGLGGYVLRRRPNELCALWIKFASAPSWSLGDELRILGRWGPAGAKVGKPLAVRADVREACLVWAARAFHNRTARYADTVQSPDGGVASYFRNLPPDVKLVVDSLELPGA